eukprot:scaffold188_cov107-Isochrysis_galbana.AAC.22
MTAQAQEITRCALCRWSTDPATAEPIKLPSPSAEKMAPTLVVELESWCMSAGPTGPRMFTDRPVRSRTMQYTTVALGRCHGHASGSIGRRGDGRVPPLLAACSICGCRAAAPSCSADAGPPSREIRRAARMSSPSGLVAACVGCVIVPALVLFSFSFATLHTIEYGLDFNAITMNLRWMLANQPTHPDASAPHGQ